MKNLQSEVPLALICRKGLGATLKSLGLIDHYWEISKGDAESYTRVHQEIENFEINFLVSAHTSFRTTLFCKKIKARKKITFAKPWNYFFFDERVNRPTEYPESIRLLSLIKNEFPRLQELFLELPEAPQFIEKQPNGALLRPPEWADPNRGWSRQNFSELLQFHGLVEKKWIALFPGSVWATKMWTKKGYIQLGLELQKKGFSIVIMGGAEEQILGQEVADAISSSLQMETPALIPAVLNLCGKTSLLESLTLLSSTRLVIGNDSSSSHMAALVGVPVVTIYGPTVLRFGYRPWARVSAVAELENIKCRPCGPHGPQKCPLGHHDCMKKLEASAVLKVVDEALKAGL